MFCWFPNKFDVNCLSGFSVDFCFVCKLLFVWMSLGVDVDVRLLDKLNEEDPV